MNLEGLRQAVERAGYRLHPLTDASGIEAVVDDRKLAVGGPKLMEEQNAELSSQLRDQVEEWKSRGAAVLFLLEGEQVLGAFALEDEVRKESHERFKPCTSKGSRSR